MKNFLKKITGIEAKERQLEEQRQRLEAEAKAAEAERKRIAAESEKKRLAEEAKKSSNESKSRKKSAKDMATEKGEPYIAILSVEVDPENISNGAFELDWNDKFITNLVRAGYEGKTDADLVDRWFQDVCRSVVTENWEQWEANYATMRRVDREDLGNGKTGVS